MIDIDPSAWNDADDTSFVAEDDEMHASAAEALDHPINDEVEELRESILQDILRLKQAGRGAEADRQRRLMENNVRLYDNGTLEPAAVLTQLKRIAAHVESAVRSAE